MPGFIRAMIHSYHLTSQCKPRDDSELTSTNSPIMAIHYRKIQQSVLPMTREQFGSLEHPHRLLSEVSSDLPADRGMNL